MLTEKSRKRVQAALKAVGDKLLDTDPDQVFRDNFADDVQLHDFRHEFEQARGVAFAAKQTAAKQTAAKQTASKQTAAKQTAAKQTAAKQTAAKSET